MYDVPDVEELRKICFRSQPDIYRKVSIYFIRFALIFGCRANHITLLRIFSSIAALLSFFYNFLIIGVLFFQLSLFLDTMDGAIARYNKETSFFGEAMDLLIDHFSSSILYFVCAGVIAYRISNNPIFVFMTIFSVLFTQFCAFARAMYTEFHLDIKRLRKEYFFVRFFNQDNMRLLLFLLTVCAFAGAVYSPAFGWLVSFYAFFVVSKFFVLNTLSWYFSGRFPFTFRIFSAYLLGVCFIFYFIFVKAFGKSDSDFRSFLKAKYGDITIIHVLLER